MIIKIVNRVSSYIMVNENRYYTEDVSLSQCKYQSIKWDDSNNAKSSYIAVDETKAGYV